MLVSIHDVQVQGQPSTLGFALVPLQPCAGVKDGWYTLHAGLAATEYCLRSQGSSNDQDSSNDAAYGRPRARSPLRSHSGELSSINLRIAYASAQG